MNSQIDDEHEIIRALEDSEMKPEEIEQFMESFHLGQWEKVNWILASHRSKLLSDVHAKQAGLYCMDFLIRKLKANKGNKL